MIRFYQTLSLLLTALMDPVAATNDTYCNTGIRMATNLHLVPEGERVTYARTIVGQRHF